MGQAFDVGKMQLSGDPVPAAQAIALYGPMPAVSASDHGVLVLPDGH